VQLVTIERKALPEVVESVGTVHAAEEAQVSAQTMGTIIAVKVREGDLVHRGQVLAVLDDAQSRAGLERAQAAVSAAQHEVQAANTDAVLAQSTLKRYETLYARKSVSPQEFDEIRTRAQASDARSESATSVEVQAKAALSQAQTALDYTRIRSPFDGVVTARRMDPGSLAAPGMPILTVESGGRFRLEADLDERNLAFAHVGETVPVSLDALGTSTLPGKVVQIVPAANPASRSFIVKIELPPNGQIRSGLFGRVRFARGQRDTIIVPSAALISRGQMQSVYVVGNDNIASLRYITIGPNLDGSVEVLSGLTPGDRVVLSPGERELGGKKVEASR
jgi:RND family efflux transporter MFP subunit